MVSGVKKYGEYTDLFVKVRFSSDCGVILAAIFKSDICLGCLWLLSFHLAAIVVIVVASFSQ